MEDLTTAWNRTKSALPDGWTLDSLRCASTGLAAADRDEDWIAVAVDRDGVERRARAGDPVAALAALVREAATGA